MPDHKRSKASSSTTQPENAKRQCVVSDTEKFLHLTQLMILGVKESSAFNRFNFRALIAAGAYIQCKDADGFTALHYAARNGQSDLIEDLVFLGAFINAKTGFNTEFKPIRYNPYIPNNIGKSINNGDLQWTPLTLAIANGHTKCVELLLYHKADTTLTLITADTPMQLAAQLGHNEIIDLLCNASASLASLNRKKLNALDIAVTQGHVQTVELLLKKGASMRICFDNLPAALTDMQGNYSNQARCIELISSASFDFDNVFQCPEIPSQDYSHSGLDDFFESETADLSFRF